MGPAVSAEDSSAVLFNTAVSDIQDNIIISDGAISGTLKYLSSGEIADYWGAGNFIALKFVDTDNVGPTNIQVGLKNPVALDSDFNGVWKVENSSQKLKVITTNGEDTLTQEYDLSGLTLLVQ